MPNLIAANPAQQEGHMSEQFIVVWRIGRETSSLPYPTQNAALQRAEELLREHGCDLEIALHLSSLPGTWFNKKRMRDWCLAGFPTVRI